MNRGTFLLAVCCLAGATILCAAAAAQKGDETRISPPAAPQPAPVKDKDKDAEAAKPAPDFPPFEKVLAGFTGPYVGLYSIYQDKKKNLIYAVIPAAQLNRPFLLATSFAGGTTYAGWQWNDYLLYFKRMGKQLVLMEKNVRYRPGSSSAEVKEVVERTYTDSVFLTVPIRAEGGGGCVIDLGAVLAGSAARFFGAMGRGDASLAEFDFKAFKFNVELGVTMPGQRGQFVKLHYSLADVNALSSPGYPPRLADDRVGYFLTAVKDFSNTKDPDRFVRYINRWNLEKRDPKLALSPPKRPIVIYIEKTVPVQYRRYVREGIELWNQAFEKCGFINAIEVRQQEAFNEFADLDPEDMRFNFFRWITSDQAFAMGPSRANPMTGEIIDADIIMDDSMVQAYLREYEEMVREVSAMTDEQKAYYRAHPARHPDRVILGELALRNAAGACPCGHEDASGLPNGATSGTPAPAAAAHDFMNGFRQCNIGRGKTRELALASLFFWMLDDEEEDKDKKDKKKTAAADRKGDQGDQGDGKAEDKDDKDDKKEDKKKKAFPEEFMGQVIREIVCHEVGHTLGLRHNFKGSTYRALDDINSATKPADTSGSIMDYNPVNIAVTGPQGYWAPAALGPYDYWAIEYGYRPVKNPEELAQIAARGAEKGLDYGTDEDVGQGDPYTNRWDAGADPIAYASSRIELVKKLRQNLIERTVEEGEGYQNLRRAFDMLLMETAGAGGVAAQFVGGHRLHRDHRGQTDARDPVVIVPAAKQREGLRFVCENILSDRLFDFPPELLRKLAQPRWTHWGTFPARDLAYPVHERVLLVQSRVLSYFTYPGTLRRVFNAEQMVPREEDCLTLVELIATLESAIWSELEKAPDGQSSERRPFISSIRRNLQRFYLEELTNIALDPNSAWLPGPVRTLARHHVGRLHDRLKAFLGDHAASLDAYTRSHLEECRTLLAKTLEATFQLGGQSGGTFLFF